MTSPAPTRRMNIDEDAPRKSSEMWPWVQAWHSRLRNQSYILELSAAEIRGRLSRATGLDRVQAAIRARKVWIRFHRAARLLNAAATEMAKGQAAYRREFGDQFPGAKKKPASRQQWRFD